MAKDLDERWLLHQAVTNEDRENLKTILERRRKAVRDHIFYQEDEMITLRLAGGKFSMRECAAPASVEVYNEIYGENNHFLHEEFSALNASYVLDIGANEGYYAMRVAKTNPSARIMCLEPNLFAYEVLKKNIENNHASNAVALNQALSGDGRDIEMEFIRQISSIGGAKLRDIRRPWLKDEVIQKRTVQSTTVAEIINKYSFPWVDILKIDVEGMEDEIVTSLGRIAGAIRRIVVERHSRELRNSVTLTLKGMGFELVYEEDPEGRQYYGDLYFLNRQPGLWPRDNQ